MSAFLKFSAGWLRLRWPRAIRIPPAALAALQQEILPLTEVGKKIQAQNAEVQAAVEALQNASKQGFTREKLLDLLVEAPNETRLAALVSMARSGLDYEFFTILTERIEQCH